MLYAEDKKLTIRLFTGAVLYGIGMALTVFAKVSLPVELAFLIVAYVILGGDVVWQAVKNISRGQIFDEHFLMSLSTIGAFAIGEYPEAVAVMLFYQIGEFSSRWRSSVPENPFLTSWTFARMWHPFFGMENCAPFPRKALPWEKPSL